MLRLVLSVLTGWLECREREVIAYLIEETGFCGACGSPRTQFAPILRASAKLPVRLC